MIEDNRAQGAIGLAGFFLSLIAGAIVIWIVQRAGNPILNKAANATSNAQANAATGWFQTGLEWLPILFLLTGMFGLIVLAIFQREIFG